MSHPQKVAVVGDSLTIEVVAMSMDSCADYQIVRMDPCTNDIQRRLTTMQPDLIVVELRAPWLTPILTLLCELPGTEIAVLDFNKQRLVLISSRHYNTQTMDDLLQRIQIQGNGADKRAESHEIMAQKAVPSA